MSFKVIPLGDLFIFFAKNNYSARKTDRQKERHLTAEGLVLRDSDGDKDKVK